MACDEVHATEFARVHPARATRLMVLEWFAYANTARYGQMLEDALRIARDLGSERWIAHAQRLKVIAPAPQRFTTEDWWPRLARLPLRRLALLVTEDAFGRISLERIIPRATPASPFDIRHVSTCDAVLSWVHDPAEDAAVARGSACWCSARGAPGVPSRRANGTSTCRRWDGTQRANGRRLHRSPPGRAVASRPPEPPSRRTRRPE